MATLGWVHLKGVVVALALVVAAGACGSSSGAGTSSSSGGPATAAASGAEAAATKLLDFRAPKVGGGTIDGRSLAGRPVAFWFWAPY